jgi:DnaJ-class molecular chaperone
MPVLKRPQSAGDLYVHLKVLIPRHLSAQQRSLLAEAAKQK